MSNKQRKTHYFGLGALVLAVLFLSGCPWHVGGTTSSRRIHRTNTGPCFGSDTLVLMADNSVKRIIDVQVGDMVRSYDVETGETVTKRVAATNSGYADHYYLINEGLKVTPPHPFFTVESGWVKVVDLKVGHRIKSANGVTGITSIEKVEHPQLVYNIGVDGLHNFFVSVNGNSFFLVHEGS